MRTQHRETPCTPQPVGAQQDAGGADTLIGVLPGEGSRFPSLTTGVLLKLDQGLGLNGNIA